MSPDAQATAEKGSLCRASAYQRIYAIICQIPRGRVATYGQIASIEGHCTPRMVGYALAAFNTEGVPWQRVINSAGRVSERSGGGGTSRQRLRLMCEGVQFSRGGRIDFEPYGWPGPDWEWLRMHGMYAVPAPGQRR